MQNPEIFLIALGLAMDAFAVSVGASSSGVLTNRRASIRLAFHFGLFQFLMPVAGWFAGVQVEPYISAVDHWLALVLLSIVGGRMMYEGLNEEDISFQSDPSRGRQLVILSIATSIDAFAVGLSLAILDLQIWYPAVVIGVITAALSYVGIKIGRRLHAKFGDRVSVIGGVLLIAIGLRIVADHLGLF
jgi:putative Mn2+ efflux pump MntP